MDIVSVESLSLHYGSKIGVEEVSLAVPEGALFGFLGPNGAGKTTMIRVLLGLLKPTAGKASIFGLDCWRDARRIKEEIGYLPGDLRLYPWLTGQQTVRLFGAIRGKDLSRGAKDLADLFDLDLRKRVRAMSRGTRQKLGIVLALAHAPRLMALDEPTAALDPLMQDALKRRLQAMAASGHTVFFSSHTLSEVEQLCDRVAIVRAGRLVADETLAALRSRASRRVMIRWQAGAQPDEPPPFLALSSRDGGRWEGVLSGGAPALLMWLASKPIEDLSLGEPDLETVFRGYYARGREGA